MDNSTRLPTLQEIQTSFQKFSIADYIVFATMLVGCAGIGIFYAMRSKRGKNVNEEDEYLMGGRNMSLFPVSMSLIASFISGITLLGVPTEVYLHGTEYMFSMFGLILTGLYGGYIVLPVFHDLQLSSTYEYLRRRFDKRVQLVGSILFAIGLTCWLPIVIYVPALAFNQVTGVNVHIVTPIVCVICIFYTSVGGLKAVVWTDVVQTVLMVGAIFIIMAKGTIDVGGLGEVWKINMKGGRIESPEMTMDPTVRHSIFAVTVGIAIHLAQNGIVNQNMIQRYLTLPTMALAQRALWIFILGCMIFVAICGYCGLLAYATYHDCDPLTTGLAKAKDQVLPLLVMRVLEKYPGLPGLFVSGVFSAALSSLSTGLNSMSAVVLEDFIKPYRSIPLSERSVKYILRGVVVVFGVICVALVFVVEKLGQVLQLSLSLQSVSSGACFGIFLAGFLLPCVNAKGAFWGGLVGMALSAVIVGGAQRAIAVGDVVYPPKPTSILGCDYTFPGQIFSAMNSTTMEESYTFPLYRISYLFYTLAGGLITVTAALIISYATGGNDMTKMDPLLFSPCIRRWLPKTKKLTTPEERELLEILGKHEVGQSVRHLSVS